MAFHKRVQLAEIDWFVEIGYLRRLPGGLQRERSTIATARGQLSRFLDPESYVASQNLAERLLDGGRSVSSIRA